jgi:hypothetical protein
MDSFEALIFLFSGFFACRGIFKWYVRLAETWPPAQNKAAKYFLGFLPVVSFGIIVYTLRALASFDVVNDFIYIIFYILLGFAWIFIGLILVFRYFDLSWVDDVLNQNNKAALYAFTGAYLGLVIIYSGANIGDGPGWWCVVFAGGLGLFAWIYLGVIINIFTQAFERITVDRDVSCGIRFGFYLLAGGIILGRASAGDWTSFIMTIVEFSVGWPVLPLTALAVIVERHYMQKAKLGESTHENHLAGSLFWGLVYISFAVFSIMMYPLPENPTYGSVLIKLPGVVL